MVSRDVCVSGHFLQIRGKSLVLSLIDLSYFQNLEVELKTVLLIENHDHKRRKEQLYSIN